MSDDDIFDFSKHDVPSKESLVAPETRRPQNMPVEVKPPTPAAPPAAPESLFDFSAHDRGTTKPSPAAAAPRAATEAPHGTNTQPMYDPLGIPTGATMEVANPPPAPKYEDHPTLAELPSYPKNTGSFEKSAKLNLGLPFASTPEGRAAIIKENLPGATFTKDQYGNPMVEHEGRKYHVNRPDHWNAQNLAYGAVGAIPNTVATLLAGLGTGGMGLIPAAIAQFGAGAGSSYLGDRVAKWAGSGEDPSLGKAALEGGINSAIPFVGKGVNALISKPSVITQLDRGGQKLFQDSKEAYGVGSPTGIVAGHADDLALHDPSITGTARNALIDDPHGKAAQTILTALDEHAAQAGTRRGRDVVDALGAVSDTQRALRDNLVKARLGLSPEHTALLEASPAVDVSASVAVIDDLLKKAAPNTPRAAALNKARSHLVLEEAAPGVAGTAGTPAHFDTSGLFVKSTPGTAAVAPTPPKYVTSAQQLEEARMAFDQLLKHGDQSLGIAPRSIKPHEQGVREVRQALSQDLKSQVPGYEKMMERYGGSWENLHAHETGANIFSKGREQMLYPDEVKAWMADPKTAGAFKDGVRSEIENKLRGSADDLRALKTMLSGDETYARQNLETVFGKKEIDKLVGMVDREAHYAGTDKFLKDVHGAAKSNKGGEPIRDAQKPWRIDPNISLPTAVIASMPAAGFNYANRIRTGQRGAQYSQDIGNILTGPRNEVVEALTRLRNPSKATLPAISAAETLYSKPLEEELRSERASGGRVGIDHAAIATTLLNKASQTQNKQKAVTSQILKQPDEMVARALAVANGRS